MILVTGAMCHCDHILIAYVTFKGI
jgi:hypothetical protein